MFGEAYIIRSLAVHISALKTLHITCWSGPNLILFAFNWLRTWRHEELSDLSDSHGELSGHDKLEGNRSCLVFEEIAWFVALVRKLDLCQNPTQVWVCVAAPNLNLMQLSSFRVWPSCLTLRKTYRSNPYSPLTINWSRNWHAPAIYLFGVVRNWNWTAIMPI